MAVSITVTACNIQCLGMLPKIPSSVYKTTTAVITQHKGSSREHLLHAYTLHRVCTYRIAGFYRENFIVASHETRNIKIRCYFYLVT